MSSPGGADGLLLVPRPCPCQTPAPLETAKEDEVTAVLAWHRVADYDAWKRVFDEVVASPLYDVVQSHRVWRGQDDPNLVFVCETFASREVAEAAYSDPAGLQAMERAGVDMSSLQVHYVDEVASGSS
jgi:hypothetical protein